MTEFIRRSHFPGQATIAYRITPLFRWGFLSFLFKPKVRVDWAAALCSPADTYDEDIGCDIAEERLDKYVTGRSRIATRGFAGTFYFPWTEYVEMERRGIVQPCILQVFEDNPLLRIPRRWLKMVN
jgi:hypothetical protein